VRAQVSEQYPLAFCLSFMASRIGTFYALAWVLPPVPELALGWVVARATTKFRQPVNLALAAFLSKASRRLAPRRPSPRLAPHPSRC
jgi:hypothetical protein